MAHGQDLNESTLLTVSQEDEWDMEDQNLLNNHELLYQECAKLPIPVEESHECNEAFWEVAKLTRELILDHNFIMDVISQKEEIIGDVEGVRETISNILNQYERDYSLNLEALRQLQEMPIWGAKTKKEIFSQESTTLISEWKEDLNEFLDSYQKIRDCVTDDDVSEGRDEEDDSSSEGENDKEQCKYILCAAEEVEAVLSVVENENDH